jgi:uncharacterized membrane protein YtjA (UPF0391 family)
MFRWTVIFLIIALIAAFYGFSDITAAPLIKIMSYTFILLFLMSLVFGGQPKKAGNK